MTKTPGLRSRDHNSLSLPKYVTTRSGVVFDPGETTWNYIDGVEHVNIDFGCIQELSPVLMYALKRVTIWYAEHGSPTTVSAYADHAIRFFEGVLKKHGLIVEVTSAHLSADRERYRMKVGRDDSFLSTAVFFRKWVKLNLPGLSTDALKWIKEAKFQKSKGSRAITTLCPLKGPLTDVERESFLDALSAAYAHGTIDMESYVLTWLFVLFGARPIQYALMKVSDFQVIHSREGERYQLRIPLAKGRAAKWREEFLEVDIIPDLAELFNDYAHHVMLSMEGKLPDVSLAPMFPCLSEHSFFPGYEYHSQAEDLGLKVKRVVASLDVLSERTGKVIAMNPRRFRYTVGTNCIREGIGPEATARRLGQRWASSVKPYIQLARLFELGKRIDIAVAAELGRLAQLCKATLIKDDESKDPDTTRHIVNPEIDPSMKAPMGSCGSDSFCAFNKPIACYTCPLFRAWLDGPHEAVFAYLSADREKKIAAKCSPRIIAGNDRTLGAVAQVIMNCREEYARRARK
ncbi:site-specific integrase [Noviherbaspirillum malthae]|uniref:site-specific integrase n=1 Tax=Noviherbaspirillum malthae TaxID=1260987 RepID=UPI00188F127D|nr:site-specific integrase [Noviherbaspirillum malthae]